MANAHVAVGGGARGARKPSCKTRARIYGSAYWTNCLDLPPAWFLEIHRSAKRKRDDIGMLKAEIRQSFLYIHGT